MYFPLKVSIPERCQEDWQQMTPVEFNQRHCRSCDRVLTDFSTMTDVQIGSHLRRHEGPLCSRFRADQLDRNIAAGGPRRFSGWRAAAAASGLLLSLPVIGQESQPAVEEQLTSSAIRPELLTPSMTGPESDKNKPVSNSVIISGIVSDENGEVLPFATVYIASLNLGTQTDFDGRYTLTVSRSESLILEVNYLGFANKSIEVSNVKSPATVVNIQMEEGAVLTGVVVMGGIRRSLPHRIFIAPVRRYIVWPTRRLINNISDRRRERRATRPDRQAERQLRHEERLEKRQVTQTEGVPELAPKPSPAPAAAPENRLHLTASPNPFTDHLNVNFYCDTPGDYQLELLNAAGQTITKQLGTAKAGPQSIKLHHPTANLPTGTYFLRLTTKEGEGEIATLIR